jgi:prepilin-type N-terminal cleavage/methylation domain-containing protein
MSNRRLQFRPTTEAGFTLLEVLVSFLLLGLLMSALYGALNLGTRTAAVVKRVTEQTQTNTLAQNFLRGLLQRALSRTISEEGERRAVSFAGGRNWVRFASTLPEINGSQLDYLFELGLSTKGSQKDLYLAYAPVPSVAARWQQLLEERVVLARDVGNLNIDYLDDRDLLDTQWLPLWSRQGRLPALVRIKLAQETGAWPEFVAQPMIRQAPIDEDEDEDV